MGKPKKAKLANRSKSEIKVNEGPVRIEHLVINVIDGSPVEYYARLCNGTIESSSHKILVGMSRADLENFISQQEQAGNQVSCFSIHGIDFMRFNYPRLESKMQYGRIRKSTNLEA